MSEMGTRVLFYSRYWEKGLDFDSGIQESSSFSQYSLFASPAQDRIQNLASEGCPQHMFTDGPQKQVDMIRLVYFTCENLNKFCLD